MPPTGISLVGQSDGSAVEVVAGASLTLRCRVPDARPPPTLLWYLDEKQIPKGGFRQDWHWLTNFLSIILDDLCLLKNTPLNRASFKYSSYREIISLEFL